MTDDRCLHCEYEAEVVSKPCHLHGGDPILPVGKTLKAYLVYEPRAVCVDCGTRLNVRVFDGMPPKGHDDNIRYSEIVMLGVGKCPRCEIVVGDARILS